MHLCHAEECITSVCLLLILSLFSSTNFPHNLGHTPLYAPPPPRPPWSSDAVRGQRELGFGPAWQLPPTTSARHAFPSHVSGTMEHGSGHP